MILNECDILNEDDSVGRKDQRLYIKRKIEWRTSKLRDERNDLKGDTKVRKEGKVCVGFK